MVRRFISLLLAVALLGVTGQGAACAARAPDAMPSAYGSMAMTDCMKMMEQAAPEKATRSGGHGDKHGGYTPADCLKCMIACAGIAAALPDAPTPPPDGTYDRLAIRRPGLASPMHGRSLPPDIQPPIA